MTDAPLPYGRQTIDEEDVRAVAECLRGAWLTQGPGVAAFEEALADATGARHAVAVANGSVALELAAVALGARPGDVGIVPAVTFLASAHCLRHAGAAVAFADVEEDTGLLATASLEAAIAKLASAGRSPRLVVPVNLAGQPTDWDAVRRLATACGARVLHDAAHSLGATFGSAGASRRVGESGADAAILSFHPVKHVTSAEGGAVLVNDAGLHRELLELRSFGMHKDPARFVRGADNPAVGPWYYETTVVGSNHRLSDVHAALGRSQLLKLDGFLARRRALAAGYDAALASSRFAGRLAPARQHPGRTSARHLYVIRVLGETIDETMRSRRALYLHLAARGIHCQVHYVPLPWQPCYAGTERALDVPLPGTERYYASCLSLPLFPAMTDADLARVVEGLASWTALPREP